MNVKVLLSLAMGAMLLSGCSTYRYMQPVDAAADAPVARVATAGKSVVTFYRASIVGMAISAPIAYEKDGKAETIGILESGHKIEQVLEPGDYAFVVGGESSNLLRARLDPDRRYYVSVSPRLGLMKARFAFRPLSADELKSGRFSKDIEGCKLVEPNESLNVWIAANQQSMDEKLEKAIRAWEGNGKAAILDGTNAVTERY